LWVLYRASPVGNRKSRPPFFTKWVCLLSLLRAAEEAQVDRLTFACDGSLPPDVVQYMKERGDVVDFGGIGNARSYVATARLSADSDERDEALAYLCEDDYLHLPQALVRLREVALVAEPGTYVTLYDHPDRYRRRDDRLPRSRPLLTGGQHWKGVESTNMTYGVDLGTLRRDLLVHRLVSAGRYPRDRMLWRILQGLGPVEAAAARVRGRRRLYAPVPTLASHIEEEMLAPGQQWEKIAEGTLAWASDARIPCVTEW
jgi:hypothetical protein